MVAAANEDRVLGVSFGGLIVDRYRLLDSKLGKVKCFRNDFTSSVRISDKLDDFLCTFGASFN